MEHRGDGGGYGSGIHGKHLSKVRLGDSQGACFFATRMEWKSVRAAVSRVYSIREQASEQRVAGILIRYKTL